MEPPEEDARSALYFLNSFILVPAALLVSDIRELRDGSVLVSIVRALQTRWLIISPLSPSQSIRTLREALLWLAETFGSSSFPARVAEEGCEERVFDGHMPTIAALVNYIKGRIDEADMLSLRGSSSHGFSSNLFLYAGVSPSSPAPVKAALPAMVGKPSTPTRTQPKSSPQNPSFHQTKENRGAPAGVRSRPTQNVLPREVTSTNPTHAPTLPQNAEIVHQSIDTLHPPPFSSLGDEKLRSAQAPEPTFIPEFSNLERLRTAAAIHLGFDAREEPPQLKEDTIVKGTTVVKEVIEGDVAGLSAATVVEGMRVIKSSTRANPSSWDPSLPVGARPWKSFGERATTGRLECTLREPQTKVLQLNSVASKLALVQAQATTVMKLRDGVSGKHEKVVKFMKEGHLPVLPMPGFRLGSCVDPTYLPRLAMGVVPQNENGRKTHDHTSTQGHSSPALPPPPPPSVPTLPTSLHHPATGSGGLVTTSPTHETSDNAPSGGPPTLATAKEQGPALLVNSKHRALVDGDSYFALFPVAKRVYLSWIMSLGIELNVVSRSNYSFIPHSLPILNKHGETSKILDAWNAVKEGGNLEKEVPSQTQKKTVWSWNPKVDPAHALDPGALPALFCDGVLLSEIVATCVSRGDGARSQQVVEAHVYAGGTGFNAPHKKLSLPKSLILLPGTVLSKDGGFLTASACIRNLEVSLQVLRARPKFCPRVLWSAVDLREGGGDVAWALLEDLFKEFSPLFQPRKKANTQEVLHVHTQRPQQGVEEASLPENPGSVHSAFPISPKPLDHPPRWLSPLSPMPRSLNSATDTATAPTSFSSGHAQANINEGPQLTAALGAATLYDLNIPLQHQERGGAFSSDTKPPSSNSVPAKKNSAPSLTEVSRLTVRSKDNSEAVSSSVVQIPGLGVLKYILPHNLQGEAGAEKIRGIMLTSPSALPLALPLPQSTAPMVGNGPMAPVLPSLPNPLPLPPQIATIFSKKSVSPLFPPISFSEALRVRSWVSGLGGGSFLPGNAAVSLHTLDTPLLNGTLLVHLAKKLVPSAPPLSGPLCHRHYSRPKNFAEARANIEGALQVFRGCAAVKRCIQVGKGKAGVHFSLPYETSKFPPREGVYQGMDSPSPMPVSSPPRVRFSPSSSAAAAPFMAATVRSPVPYVDAPPSLNTEVSSTALLRTTAPPPVYPSRSSSLSSFSSSSSSSSLTSTNTTSISSFAPSANSSAPSSPPRMSRAILRAKASLPSLIPPFPLQYLYATEDILSKGNCDAMWGLLSHLAAAFSMHATSGKGEPAASIPNLSPSNSRSGSVGSTSSSLSALLPASPGRLRANNYARAVTETLEVSDSAPSPPPSLGDALAPRITAALHWLRCLGCFDFLPGVLPMEALDSALGCGSLDPLLSVFCSGQLWLSFAEKLSSSLSTTSSSTGGGSKSKPNNGTCALFTQPRTPAVAKGNISKALTTLRSLPGVPLRALSKADLVVLLYSGSTTPALDLIEDMHGFYKAHFPGAAAKRMGRGGVLGGGIRLAPQSGSLPLQSTNIPSDNFLKTSVNAQSEMLSPSTPPRSSVSSHFFLSASLMHSHPALSKPPSSPRAAVVEPFMRPPPNPSAPKAQPLLDATQRLVDAAEAAIAERAAGAAAVASLVAERAAVEELANRPYTHSLPPSSGQPVDDRLPPTPEHTSLGPSLPPITSAHELPLSSLLPWLGSHGVSVKYMVQLVPGSPLPTLEWCDGVHLCNLVESCEGKRNGIRVALKGVDKSPRTAAARLANIRRALEALRGNNHMPLQLLWSELDVRAGAPDVVRGLLAQMHRCYH